jgi:hypothetical protein
MAPTILRYDDEAVASSLVPELPESFPLVSIGVEQGRQSCIPAQLKKIKCILMLM